jgi:hypothetical protein
MDQRPPLLSQDDEGEAGTLIVALVERDFCRDVRERNIPLEKSYGCWNPHEATALI